MKNNQGVFLALQQLWADNFVVYFMSHAMHFNVQGSNFEGDHEFFQEVYEFLFEQHDTIGEQIRQLDKPVLANIKSLLAVANVDEIDPSLRDNAAMHVKLAGALNELSETASSVYTMAEENGCYGCSTMLGDYLSKLGKLAWKAKATVGRSIK